ncbi:hypothetical protein BDY19DRAFT_934694 [Irpex rosettiformis]|uniref:Uncharacterized protein n=1 Tax=Irpex rosettiformis TaxID=378272 RepID=A0ACB8UA85_9APHY|nr:hypothetical protein BDY19DRAFT_934694 [Irpex rosettiformis]
METTIFDPYLPVASMLIAMMLGFLSIVAFTLGPFPSRTDVLNLMYNPAAMQSALQIYVESMMNYQYCALALLIAVTIHIHTSAQLLQLRLVPQALAILSASSALSCIFLLHFIAHSIALIASSIRSTHSFCEKLLQASHSNAWVSVPRIMGAAKRMLTLSLIMFACYRATDMFGDQLDLTWLDDNELLRFLLKVNVALTVLFIALYTAIVVRAFTRLT